MFYNKAIMVLHVPSKTYKMNCETGQEIAINKVMQNSQKKQRQTLIQLNYSCYTDAGVFS